MGMQLAALGALHPAAAAQLPGSDDTSSSPGADKALLQRLARAVPQVCKRLFRVWS
jgi:hypothetical protein